MPGLFHGTSLERPVTCPRCLKPLEQCPCPRDAAGNILTPAQQRISVRAEKRKGRTVTVASGFDPHASDLNAICKSLRATLATGGTATTDHNNSPSIELQGDHTQRLREALKALGYQIK